jgi:hypothetical protein
LSGININKNLKLLLTNYLARKVFHFPSVSQYTGDRTSGRTVYICHIQLILSLLLLVIICTDSLFLYPFHAPFLKLSSSVIFVSVFLLVTANTVLLFSYSYHLKSLLCLLPQFLSHYLYVRIHFNSVMLYAQSFVVLQHSECRILELDFFCHI